MSVWEIEGFTDAVVRRYQAGEFPAEIARSLGLTRNAVTAKLDRLKVLNRKDPTRPGVRMGRPAATYAPPKPKPAPVLKLAGRGTVFVQSEALPPRVALPQHDEPPGTATILTLGAHMCKWPIGDSLAGGITFCGKAKGDGPYCDVHRLRAHQPLKQGQARTGNQMARQLRRYL